MVTSKTSFLRDLTNDQNFFTFSFFSWAIGISVFRTRKEKVLEICQFPICISNDLLNMCSESFVMVLNGRAAWLASTKVKNVPFSDEAFDRTADP